VTHNYCKDLNRYSRRFSIEVFIGNVPLGGEHPIRIQSMTNTNTLETQKTVNQILSIEKAGADYVRLTVPGQKDAGNLNNIVKELQRNKSCIPLIADIHFNPVVAKLAAAIVNKVRINPGNYIDKKLSDDHEYSAVQYEAELAKIRDEVKSLLDICKEHHTAIRIGTNHGSLSDRIVNRFGDTPEGMVESVMEFLRICRDEKFDNIVVSIKASNTRIMVYANRLLVNRMDTENMHYPLHLGVTEAGEGEDGRIKSAVGIGTLLADGIGETIRVSLSEDPELEIPVARKLVSYIEKREGHPDIPPYEFNPLNPFEYQKRSSYSVDRIGENHLAIVIASMHGDISYQSLDLIGWHYKKEPGIWIFDDISPDYLFVNKWPEDIAIPDNKGVIFEIKDNSDFHNRENLFPLYTYDKYKSGQNSLTGSIKFIKISASDLIKEKIECIKQDTKAVLIIETSNNNGFADQRAAVIRLINFNYHAPVIFKRNYTENNKEDFQVKSAADLGGLFIDGLGDGIWIENEGILSEKEKIGTSFGILQASRVRVSKTEYISCPSCGRTLFDLQKTIKKIQRHTSHLKSLKIGIMGCIVNGPGEMADADYGYVGSGKGHITLYKGKSVVKRNVNESDAVDELISLIKENGDWVDP
jgi:(E)-4-hydroxy-3-methylbut-2-enyl-diphosphate synthase